MGTNVWIMIRGRARAEIRKILEAASFEVEDMDEHGDLTAYGDDDCLVVLCSNDADEIEAFDRLKFQYSTEIGMQECSKLVFTLNEDIVTENSVLWGKDEIMTYAGQAALADILGRELVLTPQYAAPPQAPPAPAKAQGYGESIPHLSVRVNREQAILISGEKGQAVCRFIPHWHYHYVSSGEKTFKDRVISFDDEGTGLISAINGLETEIEYDSFDQSAIAGDAEVLTPTIARDEAREKITEAIIDNLTQGVRVKQKSGDAIMSEDRILKPDKKDIKIDLKIVYIPVWQVKGKKIVEVNAYTGDVLVQPMDEGVELL